jgi:hypothetical protein
MHKAFTLIVLTMSLSSCGIQMPNWDLRNNNSDPQYTVDQTAAANSVVEVQKSVERLPVKVVEIPTITGVGFSAVSIQPGKNLNQKRIMAIKAARLDALRQLTEQIHGIQLTGSTKIAEAIVQSDTLRADIQGVILGARTVKIEPSSSDTYEVAVEIDRPLIDEIVNAYR